MGMYTELVFGASLRGDMPQDAVDTLKHYVLGEPCEAPLLQIGRMLMGASYYFGVSKSFNHVEFDEIGPSWVVSIRCNIKNYGSEIESFLEWVRPYIEDGSGCRDMYAVVTYEEDSEPTLYFLHDQ